MSGYVVDTSVFIASEQGRPVSPAPSGDGRISVATLTELGVGVRRAGTPELKMLREKTLGWAQTFIALSYDDYVAERLGELIAASRASHQRLPVFDAIIAATALVHDLTVWTQDEDFEVLTDLAPDLRVARA